MSYPNNPSNYHPSNLEAPQSSGSFHELDSNTIEATSSDVITRRLLEIAFASAGQESLPNAQSQSRSDSQHAQAFEPGYGSHQAYSSNHREPHLHSNSHAYPYQAHESPRNDSYQNDSYQNDEQWHAGQRGNERRSDLPWNDSHRNDYLGSENPARSSSRTHSQDHHSQNPYPQGHLPRNNSAREQSFPEDRHASPFTKDARDNGRRDERRYPHEVTNDDVRGAVRALQAQSLDALNKKIGQDSKVRSTDGASSGSHAKPKSRNGKWDQKTPTSSRGVDVRSIRADFPALHQDINGHQIVWFDNGATTHKPISVIEAMTHFYACDYSNIHRAAHTLAARATDHYEGARETVRDFINAESTKEIVFVRGTTEGINFIAHTCKSFLNEGDEILLTEMEHHANIVPWQLVAEEKRARIRVIPIDDRGEIIMDEYRRLLSPRTKLVSVTHASNTLGTIPPVEEMAQMAHRKGAKFIVDGAQSIAHMPVDVQALGCDFFVFSGHKVFAPTGIGAVYVHPDMQDLLPPWQGGGNMIHRVSFDGTTFSDPPAKFEAGTPSIGDAVGLDAALRYVQQFDPAALLHHEHLLLEHATRRLESIRGVRTIGHSAHKVGVVSFVLNGYSTEQVGKELDRFGIAVRTGHHCAQPSLRHFGLESTVRPSFALYNTLDEIDRMAEVIQRMARKA